MRQVLDISTKSWLVFIVALFFVEAAWGDSQHIEIRTFMIQSHLAQIDGKTVLVVGDSIVESWLAKPIGTCQTLNAGLGGGGVLDAITLLHKLKQNPERAKLSGIIVAIGVNDAQRMVLPPNYVTKWKINYAKMIDLALQLNSRVAVSTVLPVEDGMPLGTKYFDPILIKRLNALIRQVAKEKGVQLIDASKAFRRLKWERHYTVDGVHLTPNAYKVFANELLSGVSNLCAIKNKQSHSATLN